MRCFIIGSAESRGCSKHNDFRRKSSARWAEQLPGKRGQVRWIWMKKSPVDFSIARKGGEFVFLRFAIKSFTE